MRADETPCPPVDRLLTGHERRGRHRCWRPDGTPTALIVHTRRGRALVRAGGDDDPTEIAPGDTVLWHPGARQDFAAVDDTDRWEIVWAHFHPRHLWFELLSWPSIGSGGIGSGGIGSGVGRIPAPSTRLRERIECALVTMDSHARSSLPRATEFALNALETALLWLDAANPSPTNLSEPVHEAVLFISGHLDERLTVGRISEAAHLSTSRLAHLFKRQLGVSPGRFVEQRRIERARILLESTALSVGAIAVDTGFSSQFYFATRFKLATGVSPSDWRRRRSQ